jgi:P27 family predicted phage terminase small subunit
LRLLRGNPSKRPIRREPEPEQPPVLPDAPDFLSAEARAEWARVAPELFRLKLLTAVDVAALGAYCQSYAHWAEAERALAQMAADDPIGKGLTTGGTRGPVMNPLVRVSAHAAEAMLRFACEFAMTPVARARIGGYEPPPGPSKFSDPLS